MFHVSARVFRATLRNMASIESLVQGPDVSEARRPPPEPPPPEPKSAPRPTAGATSNGIPATAARAAASEEPPKPKATPPAPEPPAPAPTPTSPSEKDVRALTAPTCASSRDSLEDLLAEHEREGRRRSRPSSRTSSMVVVRGRLEHEEAPPPTKPARRLSSGEQFQRAIGATAARGAAAEEPLDRGAPEAKKAPSPPPPEAVSPGTPTTRDSWLVEPLPDVTPPHNSPPPVSRTKSGEEGLLEWIEANGAA